MGEGLKFQCNCQTRWRLGLALRFQGLSGSAVTDHRPGPGQTGSLTSGYESLAKTWRRAVLPHCVSPTTTILQRSNPLLSIVARVITECSCASVRCSFSSLHQEKISTVSEKSINKLELRCPLEFRLHALRKAAALLCSTGEVRRGTPVIPGNITSLKWIFLVGVSK